ncbi:hypothetical protein D3C80_2189110 [compost metagenome]
MNGSGNNGVIAGSRARKWNEDAVKASHRVRFSAMLWRDRQNGQSTRNRKREDDVLCM